MKLSDQLEHLYGWSSPQSQRAVQEFEKLINSHQSDYIEYELKSSVVMNMTWRAAKELQKYSSLSNYSTMTFDYQNSSVKPHDDMSEQNPSILVITSLYTGQCIEILSERNRNIDMDDFYSITEVYFSVSRKNQLLLFETGFETGGPVLNIKTNDAIFLVDKTSQNDENHWIHNLTIKIFQDLEFLYQFTVSKVFTQFSMKMYLTGLFNLDFYIARKEGSSNTIRLEQSLVSQIKDGNVIIVQIPPNVHTLFVRFIANLQKSIFLIKNDDLTSVFQFKKIVQKRLSLENRSFYLNFQGKNLIDSASMYDIPDRSIISLIPYFKNQ